MIRGTVTNNRQAVIKVAVEGPLSSNEQTVHVDTGFTGFLALQPNSIAALGLQSIGYRYGIVADGRRVKVAAYRGVVRWLGKRVRVTILETQGGQLVGMGMMYGKELVIQVVDGGDVLIREA